MKRIVPAYLLLNLCTALGLTGCGSRGSFSAADFDREVYAPAYAAGFDIRGKDDSRSTLVTIRNPWQGAQRVEQHLLVLRDGEQAPVGFDGQAVEAPVERAVCLSSSHIALFDALGEVRRIKGVSGIDYISNPYIRERSRCGEVRDIGYDTTLDFELLAAMRPDIILLYGVTGENTVVTGKLQQLKIPYIYIGEYLESDPRGKAEWMIVAAELCDRREQGEAVFGGIVDRYNAVAERVRTHMETHTVRRPRVLLNTPYRDTWFMPSAESYMVRLIRDAGGETYTVSDRGNASLPVDLERAYLLAAEADIWLDVGACRSLAELKAQHPKFAAMPAVRNRMVYNNDRRITAAGGSDFWESGAVCPDRILQDLATIFHPALRVDSLTYYRKLE